MGLSTNPGKTSMKTTGIEQVVFLRGERPGNATNIKAREPAQQEPYANPANLPRIRPCLCPCHRLLCPFSAAGSGSPGPTLLLLGFGLLLSCDHGPADGCLLNKNELVEQMERS